MYGLYTHLNEQSQILLKDIDFAVFMPLYMRGLVQVFVVDKINEIEKH